MGTSSRAQLTARADQREAARELLRLKAETDQIRESITQPAEPQPEYNI